VILIIGIIIIAIAVGSFAFSSLSILEKYPETELLLSGQTIEPLSSFEGLVEIDFSRDFFLGVRATPSDQKLILSLISESGEAVIATPVEGTLFEKLPKVDSGWYKLEITSFGNEPTKVYVILTAHDMKEEFQSFEDLAGLVLVGGILIIPGIIMVLSAGCFVIYKKVKTKT